MTLTLKANWLNLNVETIIIWYIIEIGLVAVGSSGLFDLIVPCDIINVNILHNKQLDREKWRKIYVKW